MGSSAARGSIVQALDAYPSIEPFTHEPQEKYDVPPSDEELSRFGQRMRVSILDYPDREQVAGMIEAYNVDAMRRFRSGHNRVVALYVTTQQRIGEWTGGISDVSFLKSIPDQTVEGRIDGCVLSPPRTVDFYVIHATCRIYLQQVRPKGVDKNLANHHAFGTRPYFLHLSA